MSTSFTVQVTEAAAADLVAIRDWLANEAGAEVADALVDKMLERIGTLERFPERGAPVPEAAALGMGRYRQAMVPPYRMIYRLVDDRVVITLIVHTRRDLPSVLQARLLRPPQP